MSSEFHTSASLTLPPPPSSRSVVVSTTTSSKSTSTSIGPYNPSEVRYWISNYRFGPKKLLPPKNNTKAATARVVKFHCGNGTVSQLTFGPGGSDKKGGGGGVLAIACGPRVGLYNTRSVDANTSSLGRALHSSITQRKTKDPLFGATEDDDEEEEVVTIKSDRNVSTGGQPTHCVSYRNDNRLLACGSDDGIVRVCDVTTRATLRTFVTEGSNYPIRDVCWLRNGKHILSAGDDGVLRVWDLSGGMMSGMGGNRDGEGGMVWCGKGHGDAVRSCAILRLRRRDEEEKKQKKNVGQQQQNRVVWNQLAVSGSYDHTIRVWDLDGIGTQSDQEHDRCLSVMDHGSPVEDILILPPTLTGGTTDNNANVPLILSAGGTTLKIWHPLTSHCLSTIPTQHSKTITSLSLITTEHTNDEDETIMMYEQRILTAGLDGLIRIHRLDTKFLTLHTVNGIKTSQPISALSVSSDSKLIVVGSTTGQITIYRKKKKISQTNKRKAAEQHPRGGTYAYFTRGSSNAQPADDDFVVYTERKKKLQKFDVALRQFRYGDALDEALDSRQPQAVAAVIEELTKRRGLTISLSNRDEQTLEPILSYTVRYITNPKYTSLLINVAHRLIDIYGNDGGQSETIDELFDKLKNVVQQECRNQRTILRLLGSMDVVLTESERKKDEDMMDEEE